MFKLLLAVSLFMVPEKPLWLHNLDAAMEASKKEGKLILLNFSGSDWCIPCIKMHDEIFESDNFTDYASRYLILVNADFPRKKKHQPEKDQQVINDRLAEKYNPNGNFPLTVLLDSKGNVLKTWDGYYPYGTDNFIKEIRAVAMR
jgi:thioredoxin-related protein